MGIMIQFQVSDGTNLVSKKIIEASDTPVFLLCFIYDCALIMFGMNVLRSTGYSKVFN